jgi:hypothetical protein
MLQQALIDHSRSRQMDIAQHKIVGAEMLGDKRFNGLPGRGLIKRRGTAQVEIALKEERKSSVTFHHALIARVYCPH